MAVYTPISAAQMAAVADRYGLGERCHLTAIAAGIENTNYRIDSPRGRFILTIFERRTRERDLPFFLAAMDHLSQRGLPVPRPLSTEDGEKIFRLAGKPAVITSFLPGQPAEEITARHCQSLGRMVGQMHRAAIDFNQTRPNDLSLYGWQSLIGTIGEDAERFRPGLHKELTTEWEYLARRWPADLPTGLIHGDIFPDNVFFQGDRPSGLIDFYFACTDSFAYDLAVIVNAWCFDETGCLSRPLVKALIDGYEEARPLQAAERKALSLLVRGAALRFSLTRLYDWLHPVAGAVVTIKDPAEYINRLGRKDDIP